MVVEDLLGPAGGPDEEVVERTVREPLPRRRHGSSEESGEWGGWS